jgi:hypothetical protein
MYDEAHALRETIVAHLHPSIGKTKEQLYNEVVGDFGECGTRRFYGNLAKVIRAGCARRDDEGEWCPEIGRSRPVYFRLPVDLPECIPWCRVCLLLGGTRVPRAFCLKGYGVIRPAGEPDTSVGDQSSSRKDRPVYGRPARRAA